MHGSQNKVWNAACEHRRYSKQLDRLLSPRFEPHASRACNITRVSPISFTPDFLEFIRLNFNREQSNVELRLKAIFVGADSDGDGNMDIDEFNSMIAITHSSLSHQQLLRMYSEMTLNSRVSSEVFVRVARLFRFCAFEVGPVCAPPTNSARALHLIRLFSLRKELVHPQVRRCGLCSTTAGRNSSRFSWSP